MKFDARFIRMSGFFVLGFLLAVMFWFDRNNAALAATRPQAPEDIVYEYARPKGIPMVVAWCAVQTESSWDPDKVGVNKAGGWANADLGLMQVNAKTARGDYGVKRQLELLTNIRLNADLGTTHLKKQYIWAKTKLKITDEWQAWRVANAAYNAGQGNWRAGMQHADKVMNCVRKEVGQIGL